MRELKKVAANVLRQKKRQGSRKKIKFLSLIL